MKEKHTVSKLVNKTRDHVNPETELDMLKAASRVMPKTYTNPDAHHQDSFWRMLGPKPLGKPVVLTLVWLVGTTAGPAKRGDGPQTGVGISRPPD